MPINKRIEEEWTDLQHILKKSTLGSLGYKRKWQKEKGIRQWSDHIEKVINNKRDSFRVFSSCGKTE